MKIVIIGTGYVGLVSGTCLADIGLDVTCVDKNNERIQSLSEGKVPIYEPGLQHLVTVNIRAGRLHFSSRLDQIIAGAEAIFITVGTPARRVDGRPDLGDVYSAAREIAQNIKEYTVVVIKSTVPIGTGDKVEQIMGEVQPGDRYAVISNPEFLREGSAVNDFMAPDRIILGGTDERALGILRNAYLPLTNLGTKLLIMNRRSAELTKYAANAFLATKVTFINEIGDLCERAGADVTEIARGIGLDHRVGTEFLKVGPGYGGSCFPKDTLGLVRCAEDYAAPQQIVETVIRVNEQRKRAMGRRILRVMKQAGGNRVAVLGVTFKADTDDLRDSPVLPIIEVLREGGADLKIATPQAYRQVRDLLPDVPVFVDPYEAVEGVDAVVIATEWKTFAELDLDRLSRLMRGRVFIDLRDLFDASDLSAMGFLYIGLGQPMLTWIAKEHESPRNGKVRPKIAVIKAVPQVHHAKVVLITGGAGFLGSHLAARLVEEGDTVYCLDNLCTGRRQNLDHLLKSKRLHLFVQDISAPLPPMERLDEIYNLACPASPVHYQADPVQTLKTSSVGVLNLLNRGLADHAAMFQASTSEIYGDPLVHPQDETYRGNVNTVGPRSCYDEGKRFAETLLTDYCSQYGLRLRMARIFNTYGPRMQETDGRVVSNFIIQALQGKPLTIYGDGSQTRSFCYVDDLIDGFLALMRAGDDAGGPMNLGNPTEISVKELAHIVVCSTKSRSEIVYRPLPMDDPTRRRPDISRAKALLHWSPKVDLAQGLDMTIDYFRTVIEAAPVAVAA